MTLKRTVLLDYELVQSDFTSRTLLQNDSVSILSDSGLNNRQGSLASGEQLTLTGINGVFFLRCSAPLQVKVNHGDYFTVTSLFVNYGSLASVVIFNTNASEVNFFMVDT